MPSDARLAIVTGAGSGIGQSHRACTLRAAAPEIAAIDLNADSAQGDGRRGYAKTGGVAASLRADVSPRS